MSEAPKNTQPVQLLTLQQRYVAVCTQLGDTAYRITLAERQLEMLRKQHGSLLSEAEKLQVEAATAAQAAVASTVETEKASGSGEGTV